MHSHNDSCLTFESYLRILPRICIGDFMRFVLLLFCLICAVSACEEDIQNEIYNENNTAVLGGVVYNIDEKPINGLYKIYYSDGNVKMEVQSKDGKPEGNAKFYDKDGSLYAQGNFSEGKPEGVFYYYYSNGEVHNELNYVKGIKDGKQKLYDENGILSAVVVFSNGEPVSGYTLIKEKKTPFTAEELSELKESL